MRNNLAALGLIGALFLAPAARADVPKDQVDRTIASGRQEGLGSWYGGIFHGRQMANGRRFDKWSNSAASRTLPLNSWAVVSNPANGRRELVKIEDRGPYVGGRIIDLSQGTARRLDLERAGVGRVVVQQVLR